MIVIIDYGCGNLNAFLNIYRSNNIASKITNKKEDILDSTHIILPGVGSFDNVIKSFNKSGLREIVEEKILNSTPLLGICAGMQILSNKSEEGNEKGLGWINGEVIRFDDNKIDSSTKTPHMGWNHVNFNNSNLFNGIKQNSTFYFTHTYYFQPKDKNDIISSTNYGINFCSGINKNKIYGVQFHPEKSHDNGQKLLINFSKI